MSKKYIKMVWDCKYCSKKGIYGDVRHCPSCGNPCGDNVKYYLPQEKVYANPSDVPPEPDWQCNYCKSYNRSYNEICSNCGASKDGTKNYFGNPVNTYNEIINDDDNESSSYPSSSNNTYYSSNASIDNDMSFETSKKQNGFVDFITSIPPKILFGVIGIISALALIAGIIIAVVPKEKNLNVTSVSWEYEVDIQQYKTVSESDWYLPSNARLKYTAQEIRSYEQVLDGYKTETYTEKEFDHYEYEVYYVDCGNGYAEERTSSHPVYRTVTKTREVPVYKDVPVYDTKYYYDIDKYVFARTEKTQNANKNPYWPENLPVEKSNPSIGDERVSAKREKYMISAYIEGTKMSEQKEYTVDFNEWNKINVGSTIKCKVYITGKIKLLDMNDE